MEMGTLNVHFIFFCQYRRWCKAVDKGVYPTDLQEFIKEHVGNIDQH